MRCVDCIYFERLYGMGLCEIYKRPSRVSDEDAVKDVPCWKLERREKSKKKHG